jgi:hypothetical protein
LWSIEEEDDDDDDEDDEAVEAASLFSSSSLPSTLGFEAPRFFFVEPRFAAGVFVFFVDVFFAVGLIFFFVGPAAAAAVDWSSAERRVRGIVCWVSDAEEELLAMAGG